MFAAPIESARREYLDSLPRLLERLIYDAKNPEPLTASLPSILLSWFHKMHNQEIMQLSLVNV